jgi:hypothetical protein
MRSIHFVSTHFTSKDQSSLFVGNTKWACIEITTGRPKRMSPSFTHAYQPIDSDKSDGFFSLYAQSKDVIASRGFFKIIIYDYFEYFKIFCYNPNNFVKPLWLILLKVMSILFSQGNPWRKLKNP